MVKSSVSSESLQESSTIREKRWPYDEYYVGNTDEDDRRNGQGENHWTGAESIEWHTGRYFRDTMHGYGDYRWRYKDRGTEGIFATYEGRFYANQLHGYGVMSYPDGRVFTGIFYKDVRWGPGEERLTSLRSNVGLWRGTQLARLTWRPVAACLVPDFTAGPNGSQYLDPFRIVLRKNVKIIGQTNSALEILKQCGLESKLASEKWKNLYAKHCTDLASALCHKDGFDYAYYKGKVKTLENEKAINDAEVLSQDSDEDGDITTYFAWNNSDQMVHMMKHCYQHDNQKKPIKLDLTKILSGPRKQFRPAAKHEYDCRTLLMASYLGHISNVAKLINDEDVYPDVADMQGNTALMYATCGDQNEVIHFLVDAGVNVDSYNDSCCTALGVALCRYICTARDVNPNSMINSLLPPQVATKVDKAIPQEDRRASEWNIKRELPLNNSSGGVNTLPSRVLRNNSLKKSRSLLSSIGQQTATHKKKAATPKQSLRPDTEYDSDEEGFSEDRRQFLAMNYEYANKVNTLYDANGAAIKTVPYLFQVTDMLLDIEADELMEQNKLAEKHTAKKAASKVLKDKDTVKSKEMVTANEMSSLLSMDKLKTETLAKIHDTIIELLSHGADPMLVRCPKPAMLLVMKSGSPGLMRSLVAYGADVNEKFPEMYNYSALDITISEPFSNESLEMVRVLLEVGADVNHRLRPREQQIDVTEVEEPGPTLLHILLAKKTDFEFEELIRNQMITLLLKYNCDPGAHYHGRSPVDIALSKNTSLTDIFINNPGTNLNAIINSNNHTILVKMFTREYFRNTLGMDRFPVLTNLLLRGADPLIECYDGDAKYGNVFEFAKKVLNEIAPPRVVSSVEVHSKGKDKGKNDKGKNGKDAKGKTVKEKEKSALGAQSTLRKSLSKGADEATEYKEALDLLTECARLLHIRWLQAKLVKELIDVIYKYKHRTWNMIIREHKNANNVGLWLTTPRCIEIWDILRTTKRKRYTDDKILKHLLCIVQYYQHRLKERKLITPVMIAAEKNLIESDIGFLFKEHKVASKLAKEVEVWKQLYVKPELAPKNDKKFKVCFECSLPLTKDAMLCDMCQMVSFCNLQCIHTNICRATAHPCSEFLRDKYFAPVPEASSEIDHLI